MANTHTRSKRSRYQHSSYSPSDLKRKSKYFGSNLRTNRSRKPFGRNSNIDIESFIQKASQVVPQKKHEIVNTFSDFNFCRKLQFNLKERNYVTPTPIQDQAIFPILEGNDLIGLANTGTGKTGAFLLPMIHKAFNDPNQKVLIIAPTRELAQQIEKEFRLFSRGMKLFSSACVGGVSVLKQINQLKRKTDFVIGTPGRLMDLCQRGHLQLKQFNNIVIDEVDRMMDMGFIQVIRDLLSQTNPESQTLFFSATLPPKIRVLASEFLSQPVTVEVKMGQTAENVEQTVVRVQRGHSKLKLLEELLNNRDFEKVLIFSETKREVEQLSVDLNAKGFRVKSIHGDKRQVQRQKALEMFKSNKINILVATDVAARGLDIRNISHVINYSLPQTYDDYIHRIGRTGRGHHKGKAITFV